jgi:hypothetical protein
MPLFGRKKETPPPFEKPQIRKYGEHRTLGATTGLALCNLQGKEALILSSIDARGFSAMTVDGERLWTFDTGATVYSLAVGNFSGQTAIIAGSNEKVFAVSDIGKELWQYQMPTTKSRLARGVLKLGQWTQEAGKRYGYNDTYHVVSGKLDGEDVVVAIAGWEHAYEGPQIISSKGQQICSLKKKYWTGDAGIIIQECLLDLSPRGDSLLAMVAEPKHIFKEISVINRDAKITRRLKAKTDVGPKNRYTEGGFQDKHRGRLVAGRLDGMEAAVYGSPQTRSVAAASLDGAQLWNYGTAGKRDVNSGINDIALGTLNGHSVVIIGTFDNAVHLVASNGTRVDMWTYPSNVTNVACGKIKGKDAIAVGLYNGQVLTYVTE